MNMITSKYTELVGATPLYPEMMASNASLLLMQEAKELRELESSLYKLRDEVRQKEQELQERRQKFDKQSSLFTLSFKTHEVKSINNKVNISVVNKDDARNW